MISSSYNLIVIIGMGVITYLTRRSLLRVPDRLLSDRLKASLVFIPPGIFASLIFPGIFTHKLDGVLSIVLNPIYITAALFCIVTMAFTRNVFISFLVGLVCCVLVTMKIIPVPDWFYTPVNLL